MTVYGYGSRYLLPGTEGVQEKRGWPSATNNTRGDYEQRHADPDGPLLLLYSLSLAHLCPSATM